VAVLEEEVRIFGGGEDIWVAVLEEEEEEEEEIGRASCRERV